MDSDSIKKKLNINTGKKAGHGHDIPDSEVEKACQLLSMYLSESGGDELQVELVNFGCKHGKIGNFKITAEKI